MFESEIEQIIAMEGTDGCGKDTVTLATAEHILNNSKNPVLKTSFPNYWNPAGTLIRLQNRKLCETFCKENNLSFEDELVLRTSMYALDRSLTFLAIHQLQNRYDQCLKQVSDRLYLSAVNTVAYLVTRETDLELAKKLFIDHLETALESDAILISSTNNVNAILQPKTVKLTFSSSRPELDQLESPTARDFANWGYALAPEIIPSIKAFIIENQRPDGAWKDKSLLAEEILKNSGLNIIKSRKTFKPLSSYLSTKQLILMTPTIFLNTFYSLPVSTKRSLEVHENKWKELTCLYNKEAKRLYKREKKEYLNEIETDLSEIVESIMSSEEIPLSESKIGKLNSWPLKAIKYLVNEYSKGNLLPFVKYLSKQMDYGNGYYKLIEVLANS